jgi:MoaA/NifB/PqqE/SkfB family radical SAM enzyme
MAIILWCQKICRWFMGIFHGIFSGYQSNTEWPISRNIFEINITNFCNLKCPNCQACVATAPDKSHIAIEHISSFVDNSISLKCAWSAIKLTGGEAVLHPKIFNIISLIEKYVEFNKKCIAKSGLNIPCTTVRLLTNGTPDSTKIISKIPKWIIVQNQASLETKVWSKFESFNVAPIDLEQYKNVNSQLFRQGCMRICKCGGAALGTDGLYYPCVVSYQIARVFKLKIGIPSLRLFVNASDRSLRDILEKTCRYCGYFKYPRHHVNKQTTSKTWQEAINDYNREPHL